MNIRGIANKLSRTVNPNIQVQIAYSTGSTIGAGKKQVPTYATPINAWAQVQQLTLQDIKQIEGLNIQGMMRTIFTDKTLHAAERPNQVGGDLITFNGQTWLVVEILQIWPKWTKALIVRQVDS